MSDLVRLSEFAQQFGAPESRSVMTVRELRMLHLAIEALRPPGIETPIGILVRPGEAPWIEFWIGENYYGMWRATGVVYQADEHGAMGDDPVWE